MTGVCSQQGHTHGADAEAAQDPFPTAAIGADLVRWRRRVPRGDA